MDNASGKIEIQNYTGVNLTQWTGAIVKVQSKSEMKVSPEFNYLTLSAY